MSTLKHPDHPPVQTGEKAMTKAEYFFLTGQDSLVGLNGELFTAAYGRWIRMQ